MNNTERRVRYLRVNQQTYSQAALETITRAYLDGTPDAALFTPAQCRRLKHKRGEPGGHRQRQRATVRARIARRLALGMG